MKSLFVKYSNSIVNADLGREKFSGKKPRDGTRPCREGSQVDPDAGDAPESDKLLVQVWLVHEENRCNGKGDGHHHRCRDHGTPTFEPSAINVGVRCNDKYYI